MKARTVNEGVLDNHSGFFTTMAVLNSAQDILGDNLSLILPILVAVVGFVSASACYPCPKSLTRDYYATLDTDSTLCGLSTTLPSTREVSWTAPWASNSSKFPFNEIRLSSCLAFQKPAVLLVN